MQFFSQKEVKTSLQVSTVPRNLQASFPIKLLLSSPSGKRTQNSLYIPPFSSRMRATRLATARYTHTDKQVQTFKDFHPKTQQKVRLKYENLPNLSRKWIHARVTTLLPPFPQINSAVSFEAKRHQVRSFTPLVENFSAGNAFANYFPSSSPGERHVLQNATRKSNECQRDGSYGNSFQGWLASQGSGEGRRGRGGDIIYVKGWRGRYGIVARGWFVPTVRPYQREC